MGELHKSSVEIKWGQNSRSFSSAGNVSLLAIVANYSFQIEHISQLNIFLN